MKKNRIGLMNVDVNVKPVHLNLMLNQLLNNLQQMLP